MRLFVFAVLLVLTACADRAAPYLTTERPLDPRFGASVPAGDTAFSNSSIASIFTVLTHDLEWGASRPNLVRFEGPVKVALTGEGANRYVGFLEFFLAELRRETGVDIRRASQPANLLIRFVPGEDFEEITNSQCIVISGQPDWETFRANQERYGADPFETSRVQDDMSVVIPNTLEPYKIRECILEEVTQALGPGNDLYGLSDTIFNDDDGHIWPTKLDYLVLRVLYDPRMRTGLDREETTLRAREILEEINPAGRAAPPLPPIQQRRFQRWRNQLHQLPNISDDSVLMRAEVKELVADARRLAPNSAYHCEAMIILANVEHKNAVRGALGTIRDALRICTRVHGEDDIRIAQLRLLKADALLSVKEYIRALEAADGLDDIFLGHAQEKSVLRTLSLQAAAFFGLRDEARGAERLRKLVAWGAYSLGDNNDIVESWRFY